MTEDATDHPFDWQALPGAAAAAIAEALEPPERRALRRACRGAAGVVDAHARVMVCISLIEGHPFGAPVADLARLLTRFPCAELLWFGVDPAPPGARDLSCTPQLACLPHPVQQVQAAGATQLRGLLAAWAAEAPPKAPLAWASLTIVWDCPSSCLAALTPHCPSLQSLRVMIDNGGVEAAPVRALSHLTGLTRLHIASYKDPTTGAHEDAVYDPDLYSALGGLTRLRWLDLAFGPSSYTGSQASVGALSHLTNLSHLKFSFPNALSAHDQPPDHCLAPLASLRHLALSGAAQPSNLAVMLGAATKSLEHIQLAIPGLQSMTPTLATFAASLAYLSLPQATIAQPQLCVLAAACPGLRFLTAAALSANASCGALFRNLSNLSCGFTGFTYPLPSLAPRLCCLTVGQCSGGVPLLVSNAERGRYGQYLELTEPLLHYINVRGHERLYEYPALRSLSLTAPLTCAARLTPAEVHLFTKLCSALGRLNTDYGPALRLAATGAGACRLLLLAAGELPLVDDLHVTLSDFPSHPELQILTARMYALKPRIAHITFPFHPTLGAHGRPRTVPSAVFDQLALAYEDPEGGWIACIENLTLCHAWGCCREAADAAVRRRPCADDYDPDVMPGPYQGGVAPLDIWLERGDFD